MLNDVEEQIEKYSRRQNIFFNEKVTPLLTIIAEQLRIANLLKAAELGLSVDTESIVNSLSSEKQSDKKIK